MTHAESADHRYIQVARTLRKEIVDGVFPVGSQLPTEHELCQRFSVSRYTVREALRRLREDNLVSSRPRAGTMVVPRPSSHAYVQDVVSINDLLAFATGARFAIESITMDVIDDELAQRTGLNIGEEWLAVRGFRRAEGTDTPVCRTEYYINRAFAAVGRMLQNHTGPIFPLIEDLFGLSIVEVRQEISAVQVGVELAKGLKVEPGTPALEMQRTYTTSDGEIAQVTVNTHPGARFRHSMTMRRVKGEPGVRTAQRDSELAAQAYASGLWVRQTLAEALAVAARDTPRREVLVDGDVRIDCETLYARAIGLAGAMLDRIPVGSVVSFMLPNWHEAAIVYHAATAAGMVVNPVLPSLRDHELAFILTDADVRMIFIPADFGGHDYAAMLHRVTAAMPNPPVVVVVRGDPQPGQVTFETLADAQAPAALPEVDPDAVRMIMYTSGTTGRAKGVLHSQNSIHALICQLGEHWLVDPGSVYLVPSPIAHIGGSIYAFEFPILLGTTAVLMDRWDPDPAVALMVGERCTHMSGATPFLQHLLAAAQRAGSRLPDLRVFICGGASVPPALIRSAADYFENAVVTRVYGSTEVPVISVGAPGDIDHAAETDGRPGIADVIIADGEIRARGPQMLLGYLHPEDEASAFDDQGYFRTGDLGRWVDGDYLVVTGRAKDIVIRNGENIAPKEVEDVLLGHPDIREIAIVGVPDPRTGERACAVIVTDQPGLAVADLREFLQATGVAKFKWPEQVAVWEALPKNDAGKVLKHRIRARLVEADG